MKLAKQTYLFSLRYWHSYVFFSHKEKLHPIISVYYDSTINGLYLYTKKDLGTAAYNRFTYKFLKRHGYN